MPQINISRRHYLPVAQAYALAAEWTQAAQRDFGIATAPALADANTDYVVYFKRTGLQGSLRVTSALFLLEINLGFLLGTYRDRIETELLKNFDARLSGISSKAIDADLDPSTAPKR